MLNWWLHHSHTPNLHTISLNHDEIPVRVRRKMHVTLSFVAHCAAFVLAFGADKHMPITLIVSIKEIV